MIDIKFSGGLGNQMFQYAFYLRMKKQYPDEKIHLDFDSYKYERFHNGFRLEQVFELPISSGLKKSYTSLEKIIYKIKVNIKRYWYLFIDKKHLITDNEFLFEINLKRNETFFLIGCWGAEMYFSMAKDEVLKSFIFPMNKLSIRVQVLASKMSLENSISIHVRRGDYLNSNFISLASTNYYMNALSFIEGMESAISFKLYIISDDIEWCKKNLKYLSEYNHEYITGNQDYEDMYLMTKCKYVIIANSTFSWWGGYLSSAKRVIAPKYITKNQKEETQYLYPNNWIVI